jgi:hypothetical protein
MTLRFLVLTDGLALETLKTTAEIAGINARAAIPVDDFTNSPQVLRTACACESCALLDRHRRGAQARQTLAEIDAWFAEDFDYADLSEAKLLLDKPA